MNKGWRPKSLKVIRRQCKKAGVHLDAFSNGGRLILVKTRARDAFSGYAFMNLETGSFWGSTPKGVYFYSNHPDELFRDEWWFQRLREFFWERVT